MVKLGELSIFRTELMGISALLILICHLYGYVDLSVTVQYILSLGNIGVDCFLFLSGVGMWNSLLKVKSREIKYCQMIPISKQIINNKQKRAAQRVARFLRL